MSDVTLEKVGKSFGATEVLSDIRLSVAHRELVVFVGPSGCGKSTLLRMIAGLEEISSGQVRIGGEVVNDMTPAERGIAMVFQSYALYPHKTVRQNMSFGLRMQGVPKPEIRQKVDEAARVLEIEPLLDRYPASLSGGQRQRVAIGRAIVRDPKIFLFDEPLSNLDAALRGQMRIEIARLHQTLDATMIYVTHDQVEAMTLADRIVVLHGGGIEQIGTPIELYERPANLFVAGFIGAPRMNLLDGRVLSAAEGQVRIEVAGVAFDYPIEAEPPDEGSDIRVGLRPNEFLGGAGDLAFDLEAQVVERLGSETHVLARTASGEELTVILDGRSEIAAGDRFDARAPSERVHLFGADGNAIPSPRRARGPDRQMETST